MLWSVLAITVVLVLVLALASLVALYVAYPSRGQEMPYAPAVGEKLRQAVDSLPVLTEDEGRLLRR